VVRKRGLPFKACVRCKALVPPKEESCPYCGYRVFSDDWVGLVVVIDPERSVVARELGFKKPGIYALKVR